MVNGTNVPTSAPFIVSYCVPTSISNGQYLSPSGSTNVSKNCIQIIPRSGNKISIYAATTSLTNVSTQIRVYMATISGGIVTPYSINISADFSSEYTAFGTGTWSYTAGDIFLLQLFNSSGAINGATVTVVFE